MALLEVRNLTMKFGSLIANHDVSFVVEEGAIVGLIGPNGAGKTTLFNCVSGVYKPTSGKIYYDGVDITRWPPHRVARLGAVRTFQVVRPLNDMSVLDNILVGAFLRTSSFEASLEVAEACLEMCHLEEYRNKRAGSLTIGLKKRLELARALATQPRLLMLDEVMAGLTGTELKDAMDLLRDIKARGITLLVVEHIMEALMPIADKVIVLDGGIKIAEGPPSEVVQNERVIAAYLGEKFSKRLRGMKA